MTIHVSTPSRLGNGGRQAACPERELRRLRNVHSLRCVWARVRPVPGAAYAPPQAFCGGGAGRPPFQGGLVRSVVLFRSKIGDKTRAVKAPQSGLSAAGWESCAESALSAGICMGKFLAAVRLWNGPSYFLTMAAQLRAVRSEPLLRGGSPGRWMNARGQGAAFVSIAATSMPIAATPGDDPCRRAAKLTRAGNCSHGCLNTTLAVNGRPASAKNARRAPGGPCHSRQAAYRHAGDASRAHPACRAACPRTAHARFAASPRRCWNAIRMAGFDWCGSGKRDPVRRVEISVPGRGSITQWAGGRLWPASGEHRMRPAYW